MATIAINDTTPESITPLEQTLHATSLQHHRTIPLIIVVGEWVRHISQRPPGMDLFSTSKMALVLNSMLIIRSPTTPAIPNWL